MRIKTFITTYEREEMLTKTVEHLNSHGIIPTIKDDGSSYPINLPQYFRHKHRGKIEYWITWYEMLVDCYNSDAELFLFMPDDFQDLDVHTMIALHYQFNSEAYVYNIINDGRTKEWINQEPRQIDDNTIQVGFTDCGFFCNREALQALKFHIDQVPPIRFREPNISSGVGQQLTMRLNKKRVNIYMPVKSLAYHGAHESKMHKEERKRNPLISK
jgi:hypothetical protein